MRKYSIGTLIQTFSSSSKWIRSTCNAFIILKIINEKRGGVPISYLAYFVFESHREREREFKRQEKTQRETGTKEKDTQKWLLINLTKHFTLDLTLTNPSSSALFVRSGRFSFSSIWMNAWMSFVNESDSPFDVPFGLDEDVVDDDFGI